MWDVKPSAAVGPLVLGMTTNEATRILGEEYGTFKRVPDAEETVYAYDSEGVHLTCDASGIVKVVSVFRPQLVSYSGIQLLGRPIHDVIKELKSNGVSADREDAGYWVGSAGLLLVEVEGIIDGIELYPE